MVGKWSKRRVQVLQVLVMHLPREGLLMIWTLALILLWTTHYCEFSRWHCFYRFSVPVFSVINQDHKFSSTDVGCCLLNYVFLHLINAEMMKLANRCQGRFPFLHPELTHIGWWSFCDLLFLVFSCTTVLQTQCQMPILCGWFPSFVRYGLQYLGFWISFLSGFLSIVKLILTGCHSGTMLTLYKLHDLCSLQLYYRILWYNSSSYGSLISL